MKSLFMWFSRLLREYSRAWLSLESRNEDYRGKSCGFFPFKEVQLLYVSIAVTVNNSYTS